MFVICHVLLVVFVRGVSSLFCVMCYLFVVLSSVSCEPICYLFLVLRLLCFLHSSWLVVVCGVLFDCFVLLVVCSPLLVSCCSLLVVCCLVLVVCCLLFVAC